MIQGLKVFVRIFNRIQSSFKSLIKFIFTCFMSFASILPILPKTRLLSIVASFASRRSDTFLRPLFLEGFNRISVSSFHISCVEINAKVISKSEFISTNAGRFLFPFKSVNGNGIVQYTLFPLVFFYYVIYCIQIVIVSQKLKSIRIIH